SDDCVVTVEPANKNRVVTAIKARGKAYDSVSGISYETDKFFVGGRGSKTKGDVAATDDALLYKVQRAGSFSYSIPVTNGDYLVTLQFAEVQKNVTAGQRIIDVQV